VQLVVGGSVVSEVFDDGDAAGIANTSFYKTSTNSKLNNAQIRVIVRAGGVLTDGWRVWEAWIEATEINSGGGGVTSDEAPLEHTRTHLFDVTSFLPSFSDFVGLTCKLTFDGPSSARTLRIVRLFYLIEFSPFRDEPADRVLADVQGLQPAGEPTEIIQDVFEQLLGLAADAYNAGDMAVAKVALAADGHVLDFAVTETVRSTDLLAAIAEQSRLFHWWQDGALRVRYRKLIAAFAAVFATYRESDVPGTITRRRTALADVINDAVVRFRYDYEKRTLSRVARSTDVLVIGTRTHHYDMQTVRDDATAASFATFLTDRAGRPRYEIAIPLLMPALELLPGDVVEIVLTERTYSKVEVESIVYELGVNPPRIVVTGRVYDTL
jgi:hypothetical protein